jgi:hypothetical protein
MADTKVWVNILDILWPVGSLYYCLDGDANAPSAVLGGTWVQKTSTLQVGTATYVCWTRVA